MVDSTTTLAEFNPFTGNPEYIRPFYIELQLNAR